MNGWRVGSSRLLHSTYIAQYIVSLLIKRGLKGVSGGQWVNGLRVKGLRLKG